MDLHDSVVVVTGAGGGGCGRAISQAFAREGAIVVVSDIDEAGGHETVRVIEAVGGRAVWCAADVRAKDQVASLIDTAMRAGDFRVLINNASGVFHLDDPLEMWQELVEIDLLGTMYGTRLAIDAFRKRGAKDGCSIVNMSSITGLWHGREHASPGYDAVKSGVIRLTTMLASLNESDGIRVNCLAPGWIAAPQVREYWEALTAEEREARHAPSRLLGLDEVADAVFRLATDESLYGRVMLWWSEDRPQLIPVGDRGYEVCSPLLNYVRGTDGKIPILDSGDRNKRLLEIRAWREQEGDAGRPCELVDYYLRHGICPKCRGDGVMMIGWSAPVDDAERRKARQLNLENLPLYDVCEGCGGTGRFATS